MDELQKEPAEKLYELAYVLKDADAEASLMKILEGHGVTFAEKQTPRETKLAYPIRNRQSGLFGYCQFRVLGSAIASISKALELSDGVLRFLIVTPPPKVASRPQERVLPRPQEPAKPAAPRETVLTNEALEKKLEEILE